MYVIVFDMTVQSPKIIVDLPASGEIDGQPVKTEADNGPTVDLKQQVSCRITNSILKYLELKGYNVDSVISDLPYSKEFLCDSLNWIEYETREIITRRAAELTHNDAVMYDVGLLSPTLNSLGGIESMVRLLAGPKTVYKFIPRYASLFDRIFRFKTTFNGDNQATITMSVSGGYPPSKASCYYAQGILAAIPTLWGLPHAEIYEKKCMCESGHENIKENVQYKAEICEWEIRWQPLKSMPGRLFDGLIFGRHRHSSKVDNIERSFRLLDQKNAELAAKNKQLAAIREIAIGVDKVRTLDEALSLAVERARDIEGIRFVFVQKVDVTGQFIITPYYSKIRNSYAARAIKALGFDAEKELANNPASKNLLRFPSMKLKIAQDYLRDPRVMVIPSLAELLDGVWSRSLCDGIQKILGVKKIVIIPLMVEGKSWGNLVYFLDQELPIDILEMVGAHCALAIKNIISLNNLESRNNELSALNRIANTTSRSLDTGAMLNSTVNEIVQIFDAYAAMIYLWDETSQALKLAAQFSVPEVIKSNADFVSSKDSPMVTFFLSKMNVTSGVIEDYLNLFPCFDLNDPEHTHHQFIAVVINFGKTRYGLMVLVRAGDKQFDEQEKALLASISNQMAIAIENSKLHADALRRMNDAEYAKVKLEKSINKQKNAENKLRESEERYRTIFESANDILLLIDNQGKLLDINARVKDIGGYEREDFIGKDFRTLTRVLSKKSIAILAKNYLKRLMGLKVPPYEVEMLTNSGDRKILEINAVALHKDGKTIGDLAILRDVTESRQTERYLKRQNDLIDRILATIPNAVLLLNNHQQVVMANKAFNKLFKLRENDIQNKYVHDLIVAPELNDTILKTLNSKEKKASIEFRYSIASSDKVLVANIFAMEENDFLLVIDDVTEEQQRQERLYLTDRLASVGEMASGVAHELNNPLTGIIGLASLLTETDVQEDVKEDLAIIHSEAQRCALIVKNLLTFARKHESKREPVQVAKIIDEVLRLRAYEHRGHNISVDNQLPSNLPDIPADYFQLQQVFLNIVLNAEMAMTDANGRGSLKITGEKLDGHIKVSFSDDGPGISQENLKLIFNPFFTTKEVGKGTGLGLSICYGIITSHGGKIYAESERGKGATFVLELPTGVDDTLELF
jgi:PAS domain S-box-containing protein